MSTRHPQPGTATGDNSASSKAVADLLDASLADGDWINALTRQIDETMELIAEELRQTDNSIGSQPHNSSTPEISKASLEITIDDIAWGSTSPDASF